MTLTSILGKGGCGKNTWLVYWLKKHPELLDLDKFCNFTLKLPNTEKINTDKLFELNEIEEPIIAIWDEAYTEDLDNRDSMSEANRIRSYLLFQARKKNMSIISIAQLNIFDIRWRELQDNSIYGFPRPIYEYDKEQNKFVHYKGDFHYAFIKNAKIKRFGLRYETALKVFPYFKTDEIILPKGFEDLKKRKMLQNPNEKMNYIEEIALTIKSKMDGKVTHDNVKLAMLKNGFMEDFNLEPYVYILLKADNKE